MIPAKIGLPDTYERDSELFEHKLDENIKTFQRRFSLPPLSIDPA